MLPRRAPKPLNATCHGLTGLKHLPSLSRGTPDTGNSIIQGENLGVLRSLLPRFRETVRCGYIDPPYNNRERHYHYHDSREHATWLEEIVARVELLAEFLTEDGSLWISIDDRELHYLKVACDAVFHRRNFVTTIVWQQRTTRENRKAFSNNHEYILVYAKDAKRFAASRNRLALNEEVLKRYRNPDGDPRGPWQSVSAHAQDGHGTPAQHYKLRGPDGRLHIPPHGRCWLYAAERMKQEIAEGNVYFGRDGDGVPRLKRFLSESPAGLTPETLWTADAVGTNDFAKKHLIKMFPDDVFDTPKPESLIQRVVEIATSPGELVLDCYLGSGTTAAVSHKLGRRYIGIEQGEHAVTHCAKRLALVVSGEEAGISSAVGWKGSGGFDFFRATP
jgi:adenine-specific DNA-methyltransferase